MARTRKVIEEEQDEEQEEIVVATSTSRRRSVADSQKNKKDLTANNEEEEEEEGVAKATKKRQGTEANGSSKKKVNSSKADSEEEEEEEQQIKVQGNNKTVNPNEIVYSSSTPLRLDVLEKRKVGGPTEPFTYTCSDKSLWMAKHFTINDLRAAVSGTTRLILGMQIRGKPVTGKDISDIVISKIPQVSGKKDFPKFVLGAIRVLVQERLKDVFGFNLFAGGEDLKMSDPWYVTNGLENDELNRLVASEALAVTEEIEEGDGQEVEEGTLKVDSDADKLRGALMIVLSIILINKGDISEVDLLGELERNFHFSSETKGKLKNSPKTSAPEILSILIRQGLISKEKREERGYFYRMGEKSITEMGKRAVIQFISQTCKIQLEDEEERVLMRLEDEIGDE